MDETNLEEPLLNLEIEEKRDRSNTNTSLESGLSKDDDEKQTTSSTSSNYSQVSNFSPLNLLCASIPSEAFDVLHKHLHQEIWDYGLQSYKQLMKKQQILFTIQSSVFIGGILCSMIFAKYTHSLLDVLMYCLIPSFVFLMTFLYYEQKYITYEFTPATNVFEHKLFLYPIVLPKFSLDYCYVVRHDPIQDKLFILSKNKNANSDNNEWYYNGKPVNYVGIMVVNRRFSMPIIEPISFV